MADRGVDLRNAVRASPIETICGVTLVAAGAFLTLALEASASIRVIGYIVSTVGTLLISWALTRVWVARHQDDVIGRSLLGIARPLSTVASQLNQAVHQARSEKTEIDSDLVEASVQHLFGVLSELQVLIGSPISVEDVVAIKARLDSLGEELAAVGPAIEGGPAADAEAKARMARAVDEVQSIKLQLESAIVGGGRVIRQETATCPVCATNTTVQLGSLPGDSAVAACPNTSCAGRYHVHRGPDGRPFSRLPGRALSRSIIVACPRCGNHVPLTVPMDGGTTQIRYCLSCFAKLQIEPGTREVVLLRDPELPTAAELRRDAGVLFLVCSLCHMPRRMMANRDGFYYAVCMTDEKLLRVQLQPEPTAPPNSPLQQTG